MDELCRLRRSEGYEVCFDERAVEAQSSCQKSVSFFDSLKLLRLQRLLLNPNRRVSCSRRWKPF